MNRRFTGTTISPAFFLAAALLPLAPVAAQTRVPSARAARTPVVVELFSSEGCSTCPPADALLKQLENTQPVPGAEVIAIEEHVDYWNHDGWVDPFSSVAWTSRQQDYVAKLRVGAEFTPEMVIDGQLQTSGADMLGTIVLIAEAARQPQTAVAIAAGKPDGKGAESFSVSVGKLVNATRGNTEEVWLAVTEDGLHSKVGAGENAGHELFHAAVLRSLAKIGAANLAQATSFSADPRVKFSSHWKRDNLHVVVFVQEKQSKRILGAAETGVSPQS
ncbi:MAG: DUF1223 domain-containing protein [Acidobacteriota bacterium]|nr:DUF1223 domain-containing protein [Acidobacteriota bacterium]